MGEDERSFKPIHAKALVLAFGTLVFTIDMAVPADLNVAIFYSFVIILCAWTRSTTFLWSAAAVFAALVFPGLLFSRPPVTGPVSWVDETNRVFSMGALFLVAAIIHFQMRGFRLLEDTITSRKKTEEELRQSAARLRLAQTAGRVGSWEWDSVQDVYQWSQECYDIFGVDSDATSFTTRWLARINSSDRAALKSAMNRRDEREEFEMDYRYEHPVRGTRWIHTRARMLTDESRRRRMFGICHDVTERKQVEAVLQESKSLLESLVEQRTSELRKLSVELMRSQDEEHRRIARELHDSFGQNLASLQINLDRLAAAGSTLNLRQEETAGLVSDCLRTVQRCIVETRTLSHLLHPPLLDEAGFASAARCYVEEFDKRSEIDLRLELPDGLPRLIPALELALFRALQESLTNVHRYSGSSSVDIKVTMDAQSIVLTVRDYGRGIPEEILRNFREHGSGVGVGLSGMRERMHELGGNLELASDHTGTLVTATLPLSNPHGKEIHLSSIA
jgi:two-component system NarL family sensor kinase